ncbi:hypothetical protein HaLaN_00400, partial [Haematococcus lacustris]
VVATLVVEGLVRNQPDVATLFNGAVLGFQAAVSSYRLSLPLAFDELSAFSDCSAASLTAISTSVAESLEMSPAMVRATCGSRKTRHRSRVLQQSFNASLCAAPGSSRTTVQLSLLPTAFSSTTFAELSSTIQAVLRRRFPSTCGVGTVSIVSLLTVVAPRVPTQSLSETCEAILSNIISDVTVKAQDCVESSNNLAHSLTPSSVADNSLSPAQDETALIAGLVVGFVCVALLCVAGF